MKRFAKYIVVELGRWWSVLWRMSCESGVNDGYHKDVEACEKDSKTDNVISLELEWLEWLE
jgi:hypothetical protein